MHDVWLLIVLCIGGTVYFFFFNDTATTEIYTLSLHDALPIFFVSEQEALSTTINLLVDMEHEASFLPLKLLVQVDRKSTRLNSSHLVISYAVFCLKKKITYEVVASVIIKRYSTSKQL